MNGQFGIIAVVISWGPKHDFKLRNFMGFWPSWLMIGSWISPLIYWRWSSWIGNPVLDQPACLFYDAICVCAKMGIIPAIQWFLVVSHHIALCSLWTICHFGIYPRSVQTQIARVWAQGKIRWLLHMKKGMGLVEIAKIEEFSCSICGLGVFMLLSGALFLMVLTASQTPSSLKVVSWSSLCRWSLAWCPTVRWRGCGWFAVTATGLTTIWAPDWGKGNIIETSKKTVTCSSQKWRSISNYWKTPSFYHTTAIFILFDSHEALSEVWALWRISLERRPGSRG